MDFDKIDPHLHSKNSSIKNNSKKHLKILSDELHKAGIKLILDMVVNHTGYHNNSYNTYPNKKIKNEWFNTEEAGNMTKSRLCGLPDINCSNVDAVDYLVNNILSWIEESGIDAIRMDTVKHVENTFWYFFKSYVKGKYRDITLIGEDLEYDVKAISKYQKDHDFDTLFDFPLYQKIRDVFIYGESLALIARPRLQNKEREGILDLDRHYTNANRLITLLDNHDLDNRFMTKILNRWGYWDKERANKIFKLALSFLFTTRGIPQIYYGTEIGLEGNKDPDNRRDMPWKNFDNNNIPKETYQKEIFEHLKKLIKIRKENESITYGYLFTLYLDKYIYAYMREFQGNTIIVIINNGLGKMPYPLQISINTNTNIPNRIKENIKTNKIFKNLLDKDAEKESTNGKLEIQLEGKEVVIHKLTD